MEESVKCIEQNILEPMGVTIKEKMHNVLNKNPGLNCLKLMRDIHCRINGLTFCSIDFLNAVHLFCIRLFAFDLLIEYQRCI